MSEQIDDKNLFMMCRHLNQQALSDIPTGYHVRKCSKHELDIWKAIHFDDPDTAKRYYGYITDFFNAVYAAKGDLFYEKCLFICDSSDKPIGSCFIWKAYDRINTVHWYKVAKDHEGRGIGRALLSAVMKDLAPDQYPVYLHTQPSSYRAIKLYSDFGFNLLSDPVIGNRKNDLYTCLPYLEEQMNAEFYTNLKFSKAPQEFLDAAGSSEIVEF